MADWWDQAETDSIDGNWWDAGEPVSAQELRVANQQRALQIGASQEQMQAEHIDLGGDIPVRSEMARNVYAVGAPLAYKGRAMMQDFVPGTAAFAESVGAPSSAELI